MSARWISRVLGSLSLLSAVVSGCSCSDDTTSAQALSALGEGCLLNSDCSSELVCVFRRCHQECATTEDCTTPLRCVLGERPGHVCQLGDEVACKYDSDCPGVQRCSTDGECRDACVTSKDCVPGQTCAAGVCAEPDEVATLVSKPRTVGESCGYDSDCDGQLICKGGVCSWPCKAAKDCGGRACIKDGPDDEFGVCDAQGTGGGGGGEGGSGAGGGGAGGGEPSLCGDHVLDGDETDVDCGGSCAGCDPGGACTTAADCVQAVCLGSVCQDATCVDGVRNGSEAGVDCGGNCPDCAPGQPCNGPADCNAGACKGGVCVDASCADGLKNGAETGIDCGGGLCPACDPGKPCILGGDCTSGVCQAGACIAATCSDFVKNAAETAIDCGGGACPACAPGLSCVGAPDCASGVCTGGTCQVPSCTDSVLNGGEGDVDCGGGCAVKCPAGASCNLGADCQSGACAGGVCAQTFSLTIAPEGSGLGQVTSSPAGISCGATCTASFVAGQTVTLTAVALSGAFTGWGDPACPGLGPCTIAVDQMKNVAASFDGGPGTASFVKPVTVAGNATPPLIAEAPNGDLYFAMSELGVDFGGGMLPSDGYDIGVGRFNANAQYLQSMKLGSTGAQTLAFLGIDPVTSDLIVAGKTDSNTTFGFGPLTCPAGSIVIGRFTSGLAHVWSECFGAPGGQQVDLRGGRMAGGSFVLFGGFTGTAWLGADISTAHTSAGVGDDMFVARYSLATGAHQGAATFGGNGIEDRVYAVDWDGAGKLAVAATCSGTLTIGAPTSGPPNSSDACVFQLDATTLGVLGSVRRFGDVSGDVARFIGYRPNGEIVVAGEYAGLVDFMSDGVGGDVPALGPHDMFVQGLSGASLSPLWVKTFGTLGDDAFLVFDLAPNGDIVLGGFQTYVFDFGGGPTLPSQQPAVYLVKLVGPGTFAWDAVDTNIYLGLPQALTGLQATATSVFASTGGTNVAFGGSVVASGLVVAKLAL